MNLEPLMPYCRRLQVVMPNNRHMQCRHGVRVSVTLNGNEESLSLTQMMTVLPSLQKDVHWQTEFSEY